MADEEGDDEYVSENVQEIVKHAMNQTLQNAVYSKEKVNHWCNQLLDSCLKELAKLNKPFKYVGIGLGEILGSPQCFLVSDVRYHAKEWGTAEYSSHLLVGPQDGRAHVCSGIVTVYGCKI